MEKTVIKVVTESSRASHSGIKDALVEGDLG